MNKSRIDELWRMHTRMDPDYMVEVLNISTTELIDAFPTKFVAYLEAEFDLEELEEGWNE